MRMFLVDTENKRSEIVDVKKGNTELQQMYDLMKCKYVELVQVYIGGKVFTVVCDEDARLSSEPKSDAIVSEKFGDSLIGNCIICDQDSCGEFKEISEEDVKLLESRMNCGILYAD